MINKDIFIQQIEYDDKNKLGKIYDKIILCNKINTVVYTNEFYPPNVWKVIQDMQGELGVMVHANGVFEYAERRIMAFSPDQVWDYPIDILCIESKSNFTNLSHRDYMGAIMSLGINREKFGDIVLADDKCYVAIDENLTEYIIDNIKAIGKSPCVVSKLDKYFHSLPQYSFEDKNIIVSSMRIDCIVSSLTNLSRNKVMEFFKSGKVLLNYITVKDKDKIVKNQSIITIRGYGKFKLVEEIGYTGSGRIKVLFKKFN